MRALQAVLVSLIVLLLAANGAAEIPHQINYQGFLADNLENPITGDRAMVFRIFAAESGGTPIWTETHAVVSVLDGEFDVLLGSINAIPEAVFDDTLRWLEVAIGGETMTPRERFVSVPYSYRSSVADSVRFAGNFFDSLHAEDAPWLRDNVTFVEGPNVQIEQTGNAIVIGAVAAAGDDDWTGMGPGASFMRAFDTADKIGIGQVAAISGAKVEILDPTVPGMRVDIISPTLGGTDGVEVTTPGDDGLFVNSAGDDGVYVDLPGDDGLFVNGAGDDGVFVTSAAGDGVEILGAGIDGILVNGVIADDGIEILGTLIPPTGPADDGVAISYPGDDGVYVEGAAGDGVEILGAGIDGILVNGVIADDGIEVRGSLFPPTGPADDGVAISYPGDDGVYVEGAAGDGVDATSWGADGVHGRSVTANPANAGVHAEGNGDRFQAAALEIDNGAITVSGASRPAGFWQVPCTDTCETDFWECPQCDHRHRMAVYGETVVYNDLIRPESIILLTVQGGVHCFAEVISVAQGSAWIRQTSVCWPPAGCGQVNYLIINPQ